MQTAMLKDLKLKKDKDGYYYLRAVYEREDDYRKEELVVPHIPLNLWTWPKIHTHTDAWAVRPTPRVTIELGSFDEIPLMKGSAYPDAPDCCYAAKILEEKTQTMTLAEIEKKLGYKINLVAEKED